MTDYSDRNTYKRPETLPEEQEEPPLPEQTLEEAARALHTLLKPDLEGDPFSAATVSIAQILQWTSHYYSGDMNDREFMILDCLSTVLHTLDPHVKGSVIHLAELDAE